MVWSTVAYSSLRSRKQTNSIEIAPNPLAFISALVPLSSFQPPNIIFYILEGEWYQRAREEIAKKQTILANLSTRSFSQLVFFSPVAFIIGRPSYHPGFRQRFRALRRQIARLLRQIKDRVREGNNRDRPSSLIYIFVFISRNSYFLVVSFHPRSKTSLLVHVAPGRQIGRVRR